MWGSVVAVILEHLKGGGSGTARAIAEATDRPYDSVRRALLRMADAPRTERRARIRRWTYEGSDLEKAYLRAVYTLGPGNNAPRPDPKQYNTVRRESACRAHVMLAPVHPGITQKRAVRLRARINRLQRGS